MRAQAATRARRESVIGVPNAWMSASLAPSARADKRPADASDAASADLPVSRIGRALRTNPILPMKKALAPCENAV